MKEKCELFLDHTPQWAGDGYFCSKCMLRFVPHTTPIEEVNEECKCEFDCHFKHLSSEHCRHCSPKQKQEKECTCNNLAPASVHFKDCPVVFPKQKQKKEDLPEEMDAWVTDGMAPEVIKMFDELSERQDQIIRYLKDGKNT